MKLLLFDIDGTLLHTDGLSVRLFTQALVDTFDVDIPRSGIRWGGRTDRGIAEDLLRQQQVAEEQIQAKLPKAFDLLSDYWLEHGKIEHFDVYADAVRLLDYVAAQPDGELAILTANCWPGAENKLRIAGLNDYFKFKITGDMASDRNDLPSFVPKVVGDALGGICRREDCVIIGDTPADIACARAHNMQAVAVSTGRYSAEELADHRPDLLVNSLAPNETLMAFLGQG